MGARLAGVSVTLTAQLFAYIKHDKTSPAKKSSGQKTACQILKEGLCPNDTEGPGASITSRP